MTFPDKTSSWSIDLYRELNKEIYAKMPLSQHSTWFRFRNGETKRTSNVKMLEILQGFIQDKCSTEITTGMLVDDNTVFIFREGKIHVEKGYNTDTTDNAGNKVA